MKLLWFLFVAFAALFLVQCNPISSEDIDEPAILDDSQSNIYLTQSEEIDQINQAHIDRENAYKKVIGDGLDREAPFDEDN